MMTLIPFHLDVISINSKAVRVLSILWLTQRFVSPVPVPPALFHGSEDLGTSKRVIELKRFRGVLTSNNQGPNQICPAYLAFVLSQFFVMGFLVLRSLNRKRDI